MKIQVAKSFNLLLSANDKPIRYEVGEHEVDDAVANHWYTREHLAKPPEEAAEVDAPTEAPAADPAAAGAPDFAVMSDDELLAWIGARDKKPHPKTGRDKLLAKAVELAAAEEAANAAAAAEAAAADPAASEGEGGPDAEAKQDAQGGPEGGEGGPAAETEPKPADPAAEPAADPAAAGAPDAEQPSA